MQQVDYRAWYGLGQTYEMLHLYQYAHFYYRKAAYLRPFDARMWGAVGNCMLKLGIIHCLYIDVYTCILICV